MTKQPSTPVFTSARK